MKKIFSFLSILLIISLVFPFTIAHADDNGVDDLRGRWDVEWVFDGNEENPPPPLILYINDLVEIPYMPNMVFAGGCMRSPDTDTFMPLSLAAVPDPNNGTYEVKIYSTVVPSEDQEPFVIRLTGEVSINGKGVPDDAAGGDIKTEFGTGQWSGIHHDRRRTKCPSVNYGNFAQADVRLSKDLAYDPPKSTLVLELYTVVVSSAMQVELPDGSTRVIEQYTDLFSPDVDFVGRFRYFGYFEGESPVVGEPYTFTLLDVFGNPIPGSESTDVFQRCTVDAPRNINADDAFQGDVMLNWDPVPVISDEFDPMLQGPGSEFHLPYQVNISAARGDVSGEFGALGVNNSHVIPWNEFDPGGPGNPDGFDFGQSLSSFKDGLYQISLDSWNLPVVDQGGHYQDCEVHDSFENLFMEISDGQIAFTPSGSISGVVTSGDGTPIPDIWVAACEYDNEENPFCQGGVTNGSGQYRITGLLPGDYRVQAGGSGWTRMFYDNTPDWNLATRVATYPGADTGGIDFELEPAGSISGTVYDDQGAPLANIAVDVEDGGYGTCTDENGNYTLEGLPFGTYRVAAGRDFCEPHSYIEQTSSNIVIDAATPDIGGIDFTMELGGSISGTVLTDENPVVGIWVDACHESVPEEEWGQSPLCNGASTDENGDYEIANFQPGNYRVVIWGDNEYVDQFYDGAPAYDSANLVPVVPGQVAENVDFNLMVAGSISGTVLADENPVVGIWVDACHESVPEEEWGQSPLCNGVSTDENGDYIIPRLHPGHYRVVTWGNEEFGHEFYNDVQSYAEATLVPVVGGQTVDDIDFSLETYVEPNPQYLNVQPDHMWADSGNWAEGAEVTLSFGTYSASQFASADGTVWFDLSGTDIAPGVNVNVTDGVDSKDLLVVSASFDSVDVLESTAWGTAPAGMGLGVAVVDENGYETGFHWVDGIQADENGNWSVDFDDFGQGFDSVIDAWVHVFDDDGDSTLAHLEIPTP